MTIPEVLRTGVGAFRATAVTGFDRFFPRVAESAKPNTRWSTSNCSANLPFRSRHDYCSPRRSAAGATEFRFCGKLHPAVFFPVGEVQHHAHDQPDDQAQPCTPRQACHQSQRNHDPENRHQRHQRGLERPRQCRDVLTRRTQTPAQTMTNASSVPMLTSSPKMPMGINAAKTATKQPTRLVEIQGVRKRGWMAPAHCGSNPSRDME